MNTSWQKSKRYGQFDLCCGVASRFIWHFAHEHTLECVFFFLFLNTKITGKLFGFFFFRLWSFSFLLSLLSSCTCLKCIIYNVYPRNRFQGCNGRLSQMTQKCGGCFFVVVLLLPKIFFDFPEIRFATNIILMKLNVFVATKHVFCRDKSMLANKQF